MSQNHSRNSILTSGRVGRPYRVEYVNRAGMPVNPSTGRPKQHKNFNVGKAKTTFSANLQSKFISGNGKKTFNKEKTAMKWRKPLPIKKRGTFFGGLDPVATDPTVDPAPHVCYNCWQPYHIRKNCQQPVLHRFCSNCGRRDEDLHTCPRCSRVYRLYIEMLQAKERGESVNEYLFESGFDESGLNALIYDVQAEPEDNACNEVLQEIIHQDQKKRPFFASSKQYQQQQQHQNYVNDVNQYNLLTASNGNLYTADNEEHLDNYNDSLYQYNRDGMFLKERRPSQQEHHIGLAVFNEHEAVRDQESKPMPEASVSYLSTADYYHRDPENGTRSSTSPHPRSDSSWRRAAADTSNADPVKDILLLAKTISHLSPDTQDLIMRQVIEERKDRVRQRTQVPENEDDAWL